MLDWPDLIARRNKWIAHNFPNPTVGNPGESILGIIEEVGELAHADLKERQAIRGTPEEHQRNARDAIGDITVYLWGVMDHYDIEWRSPTEGRLLSCSNSYEALLSLATTATDLAYFELRPGGRAPREEVVAGLTFYMARYCALRGWDYDAIVMETWGAVERRDWIAYPDNGLPSGDGDEPSQEVDAPDMTIAKCGKDVDERGDLVGRCALIAGHPGKCSFR